MSRCELRPGTAETLRVLPAQPQRLDRRRNDDPRAARVCGTLAHSVSESNVVSKAEGEARDLGGFHGHEQVVHYRSGDSRCAAHSLVFPAWLYAYCAHGQPTANHSACAAAIVQ